MSITSATAAPPQVAPERTSSDRAAESFEAWFVGFLAHEALGKGMLGEADTFSGFFEEELGKLVAEGPGIGLADQLREAMSRQNQTNDIAHAMPEAPPIGRVTSNFGTRHDPFDGGLRHHAGIDLAAPVGTPVHAPRDGVVRFAGVRGGYGNVVVLDHGDGTETRYAHCDTLAVRPGEVVRAGTVIAAVGATGRATGPHLHMELRRDGHAVDPTREVTKVLATPVEPGLRTMPGRSNDPSQEQSR